MLHLNIFFFYVIFVCRRSRALVLSAGELVAYIRYIMVLLMVIQVSFFGQKKSFVFYDDQMRVYDSRNMSKADRSLNGRGFGGFQGGFWGAFWGVL
jgi:hypothetical protein